MTEKQCGSCKYYRKSDDELVNILNNQLEKIKIYDKELMACYDTLTTIIELCNTVLGYDFKNVNDKADFCHMLNDMDNKDLAFLKECFKAIRNRDLRKMNSLTMEIKEYMKQKGGKEND